MLGLFLRYKENWQNVGIILLNIFYVNLLYLKRCFHIIRNIWIRTTAFHIKLFVEQVGTVQHPWFPYLLFISIYLQPSFYL